MADDTALLDATQPLSFAEFLDKMKDPAASDLVRTIKQCDEIHPSLSPHIPHTPFPSFLTKA